MNMLVAYDDDGDVIATLHYRVARDADQNVVGLIDFAAHEASGREHLEIWRVERVAGDPDGTERRTPARGSKVWPERIGSEVHDFKVELDGPAGNKRIVALVHKQSGYRRERPDSPRRVVLDEDGRDLRVRRGKHPEFPLLQSPDKELPPGE